MDPMRWTTWAECLSLAAALTACGDTSDSDDVMAMTLTAATMPPADSGADENDDRDDDGTTSSRPDDPMDDDGAPPITTGVDDGGADTGAGDTEAGDTGAAETGVADDATTTGMAGGICDPDPADDPCDVCTKTSCCPQLTACEADVGCSCFIGCVDAGGDPFACSGECGVSIFGAGATGELVSCSSGPCAAQCV